MNNILLTQDTGFLKPIVWILGKIMDGIFTVIDFIGIPNIGLAIILFTIVVNLLMLPLTIKQQKFSKLSAKVQPDVQKIRDKYKNRKDQESQIAMNQEMNMVYAKYGISPTGSCLPLLIQMPILFSLYRVINSMPAYVGKVGDAFRVLAQKIMDVDGAEFLKNTDVAGIANTVKMYGGNIVDNSEASVNGVIDVLNRLSTVDMNAVAEHYDLTGLALNGQNILSTDSTRGLIDTYNNFLGLNIANSPQHILSEAINTGMWAMAIGAILLPLLCLVTQWINTKLIPTNNNPNASTQEQSMQSSLKTMNIIMPIISAYFCFSWASGLGIYWVAGSVVRIIQQIVINKSIDKMDFEEYVRINSEKNAKKIEKMKENQEKFNAYANMKTKNINTRANVVPKDTNENRTKTKDVEDNNVAPSPSTPKDAKPGSMLAKANMVRQYNEKNNK